MTELMSIVAVSMEYTYFTVYDTSWGNRSLQSDGKQKQYSTRPYSRLVKLVCFKL